MPLPHGTASPTKRVADALSGPQTIICIGNIELEDALALRDLVTKRPPKCPPTHGPARGPELILIMKSRAIFSGDIF
jgi:hypothetical protein